jgi:hypothetical protein
MRRLCNMQGNTTIPVFGPAASEPTLGQKVNVLGGAFLGKAGAFTVKALKFVGRMLVAIVGAIIVGLNAAIGVVGTIIVGLVAVMAILFLLTAGADRIGNRPPDAGILGVFGHTTESAIGVKTYEAPFSGTKYVGIPWLGWSELKEQPVVKQQQ